MSEPIEAAPAGRGKRHGRAWRRSIPLVVAFLLLTYVGASVVSWQVERYAMRAYRVPSSGMEPTLHCARPAVGCEADTNDRVLVSRFDALWTPSRGDIVAFRTPPAAEAKCGTGGTFVKRIVGLPGERVQLRVERGAAFVYVDGRRLEEPYVEQDRRDSGPGASFTVPRGSYFVMGDNRSQSCDSRIFGPVPRESFVGPVVAVYWPVDRIGSA